MNETMNEEQNDEASAFQSFLDDGKLRINAALYSMVPAGMTMGEFDELTGRLFDAIRDAWNRQMGKTS